MVAAGCAVCGNPTEMGDAVHPGCAARLAFPDAAELGRLVDEPADRVRVLSEERDSRTGAPCSLSVVVDRGDGDVFLGMVHRWTCKPPAGSGLWYVDPEAGITLSRDEWQRLRKVLHYWYPDGAP